MRLKFLYPMFLLLVILCSETNGELELEIISNETKYFKLFVTPTTFSEYRE